MDAVWYIILLRSTVHFVMCAKSININVLFCFVLFFSNFPFGQQHFDVILFGFKLDSTINAQFHYMYSAVSIVRNIWGFGAQFELLKLFFSKTIISAIVTAQHIKFNVRLFVQKKRLLKVFEL